MEFREISIEVIDTDKNQPRKNFEITEIKESIKENGVLIPIIVQPTSHGGWADYVIVDGERRYRASKELGLKTIPAIINYERRKERFTDQVIIDHQRHSLSLEEKSEGWLKLLDEYKGDFKAIAQAVGVSINQVKNVIEGVKFKERVKDQLPDDLGSRERAVIRRTNRIKDDNLRAKLVIKAIEDDESNKLIDEKVKILGEKNLDEIKLSNAEQKIILNAVDIDEAIISIQNMRREAESAKQIKVTKKKASKDEISGVDAGNDNVQDFYPCPSCQSEMKVDDNSANDFFASLDNKEYITYQCNGCSSFFVLKR